jgi:hypothetical protein
VLRSGVSACSGVAAGGGATLGVVLVGNTTTAVVVSVFLATTGLVGGVVFVGVGGCFAASQLRRPAAWRELQ